MSSVGAALNFGEDNREPSSPILIHQEENGNRSASFFVKDPFVSNESVPFQAGFRPGEPQFGGFGASDFGQRFEKMSPIHLNKQMVPSIRTSVLPSRLGNVYQPNDNRRPIVSMKVGDGAQRPPQRPSVVFVPEGHDPRVPADAAVRRRIRPFRLDGPNSNGRPPIAVSIRAEGPIDHRPALSNDHPRRQFIVQSGGDVVVPPKKAMPADDPILTNVWSIINTEKIRVRGSRKVRETMDDGELETPFEESEPEMPSKLESASKGDHSDHSDHETSESGPETVMMTTTMKSTKPSGSGSTSSLAEITFRNHLFFGSLFIVCLLRNTFDHVV